MKNIIFSLFVLSLLAGCGMSQGDAVIALPNDSPIRSGIDGYGKYKEITGTFEKKVDGKVIVTAADGRFHYYDPSEVFMADDESAQQLSLARGDFFLAMDKNDNDLNNTPFVEILQNKAAQAKLNDWVEYLDLVPDLLALKEQFPSSGEPVPVKLIGAWGDAFDSLDDLEDEIANLSAPNKGSRVFSNLIDKAMPNSVNAAIDSWIRGYPAYESFVRNGGRNMSGLPELALLPEVVKSAFKFVPLSVKEKEHEALLTGLKLTDAALEKVHKSSVDKIISSTMVASIQFAKESNDQQLSGLQLAQFLVDNVGYPKQALAHFYDKESWGDLLASVKEQDAWSMAFLADGWSGKIELEQNHQKFRARHIELLFTFEGSLLKPIAILLEKQRRTVRAALSKRGKGVQIDSNSQNDWSLKAVFNEAGKLMISGDSFPGFRNKLDVSGELDSLAEIKRLEAERQAKVDHIQAVLKSESWYGVRFAKKRTHWLPETNLIEWDFSKNIFAIQGLSSARGTLASASFKFDVDGEGHGVVKNIKPTERRHWQGGYKWAFSLDEATHILTATMHRTRRNPEWKVVFVTKSVYMNRLHSLSKVAQGSWLRAGINRDGELSAKGTASVVLHDGAIEANVLKLNGDLIYKNNNIHVKYIMVPAMEQGAVLSTWSIAKNRYHFKNDIAYSQEPMEKNALFQDWKTRKGYKKLSGDALDPTLAKAALEPQL
ncbi:MAG: hypothetical protein Q9M31_06335 [Mariprofundus sp.]|nr:hypothetical protein [Mariprofundus sp.]